MPTWPPPSARVSVLTALGFPAELERPYQQRAPAVGAHSSAGWPPRCCARPRSCWRDLAPLVDAGAWSRRRQRRPVPAARSVSPRSSGAGERAPPRRDRLDPWRRAIPFLTAGAARPGTRRGRDVEPARRRGQLRRQRRWRCSAALIAQSQRRPLWLRPDQWRDPARGRDLTGGRGGVAPGRRSRAIYPVRALHEAPEVLRARAEVVRRSGCCPTCRPGCSSSAARTRCFPSRSASPTSRGCWSASAAWSRRSRCCSSAMGDGPRRCRTWTRGEARPDLRRFLLRAAGLGRPGRADRPHARHQPAHGAPAGRRRADRARARHPLPGRRRGGPPRVALRRSGPRGRTIEYAAGSTCQVRCRSGPKISPSALHQNGPPRDRDLVPRR